MPIYYFDLHNNEVEYIGIKPITIDDRFGEQKHQLELRLQLSRAIPMLETVNSIQRTVYTTSELAMLEVVCLVQFKLQQSRRLKRFALMVTDDARLYISGNTAFRCPINKTEVEQLNSWRNGETLDIIWELRGFVAVTDSITPYPVAWLDASNRRQNVLPSLDSNNFYLEIMRPLDLLHTFVEDFPLEIPSSIVNAQGLPQGISGLMNDLKTLVEHLTAATRIMRESNSSEGYRHVMDEVKSSLDTLRNYPNKKDLAKEILVQTGIIGNTDASMGGDTSAEQYINYFFKNLENIYQMASKPAHTKLRGQQSPIRFSMMPDRSDAIFVLVSTLSASKFLMAKINAYINTVI
jgi:hypothetical protein